MAKLWMSMLSLFAALALATGAEARVDTECSDYDYYSCETVCPGSLESFCNAAASGCRKSADSDCEGNLECGTVAVTVWCRYVSLS